MEIKTKTNKWELIKGFCTAKAAINKMKRQSTKQEKIFANDVTNKSLISQIDEHHMQLNIKKRKQPNQKTGSGGREFLLQVQDHGRV